VTLSRNAVAAAIVAAVLAAGGTLAVRTFGTHGQDAIDRMSPAERAYLARLQSLRRGMTFEQVAAVLGAPDDEGPLRLRPRWNVDGNPLSAVAIYLYPGGADHFTWLAVGRFTYQETLAPPGRAPRE
jgi:hypothetical protein